MPAQHRHHHSSERRKSFTITLESRTRSAGICVHDALETATTMSRNMHDRDVELNVCLIRDDRLTKNDAGVDLRICKTRCYTFRQRSISDRWTRRFIMAKPIPDNVAFAKHFIDSALKCLDAGQDLLALQALGNACKILKKKVDGAA
jgi:hypothetical protein